MTSLTILDLRSALIGGILIDMVPEDSSTLGFNEPRMSERVLFDWIFLPTSTVVLASKRLRITLSLCDERSEEHKDRR